MTEPMNVHRIMRRMNTMLSQEDLGSGNFTRAFQEEQAHVCTPRNIEVNTINASSSHK
jgi:hypothetical protein